ncbi:hypothetical protein GGQ74_002187 [Desulfobaculum xiamenense]|uniref:Uncharacterized protein n=1 Tax=Desulfobaculum xiamenense TaxID=995050 RepID=A0A846QTL2_9BACT|nr:hypothetical protein [Desulfobaculum xiamenense]NJB68514.1 hypothetical protein [Desulfobaculum xiamenense]
MIDTTDTAPETKDPISELFDIASALHFLQDILAMAEVIDTQPNHAGASYLIGLLGNRTSDIATHLWDNEVPAPATSRNPQTASAG